ncbi:hypothetical protein E4O86_22740 [Rhizobiales bacterium L72]|uniref:Glycosyl transferase family 51 domain-containing protein n=1 Tax=Propylenella binzhouense TaxID=2555902 RepID=A0A964T8N7_9HYPH|nr:hypothetical protein [Propylenella binzhouense]
MAVLAAAFDLPAIGTDPATGESFVVLPGGAAPAALARDELPDDLVHAVLAIEDRRFYSHIGVDLFGISRAALENYKAGGVVEGGSTITQQLAKVLFLDRERTIRRKLEEAAIALWLDARLSKDEILTTYLDNIYFGAGATGISAAAEVYFSKPVADLTLAESAMLAGLIRAPSRLNPLVNLRDAQARAAIVLRAMLEEGYLSAEEMREAIENPAVPTALRQGGSP